MKSIKTVAFVLLLISLYSFSGNNKAPDSLIGNTVNDFSLRNIDNKNISLNDFKNAKGFIIVFTCNHCPFAKLYSERLNMLNEKYKSLHVPLIAINSTDSIVYEEETFAEMIKKVKEKEFNFPYLQDNTQAVAKYFGAVKTPHAFVIWKENNMWKIKYKGAIDDNGAEPKKVTHAYVEEAVDALLHSKTIAVTETRSIGCAIKFRN